MAAAGVVHQAIAGAEFLDMIFVGEAHPAGDDEIELLAGMVGKVDRLILLLLKIRGGDDERLGELVLEARGLVQVLETGAALDGQALPRTGERVAAQMRVLTRQDLDDVDAELLGAFVEEGEGQILLAGFLRSVFGKAASGRISHFLLGDVHILAKGANTPRDLFDVRLHERIPPSSLKRP